MSCNSPISAWRLAERGSSGRNVIAFKPKGLLVPGATPLSLPCGKCWGCRLEWSRGWAVRCVHESKMHKQSMFLTLTYDRANLPGNGSLVPRDLQLFLKRMRVYCERKHGVTFRFYGCGEYGTLNKRPHYHLLIFGFEFVDKLFYSRKNDVDIFVSKTLDQLWGRGECKIGAVTFESAQYVANYCLKKVDGAKREAGHYLVYDSDGVISERVPEFSRQSLKPGIGFPYFQKYGGEIMLHDTLIMNGKEVPTVRYYDQMFERLDPHGFRVMKAKRAPSNFLEVQAVIDERMPRRQLTKEKLAIARQKQKERNL